MRAFRGGATRHQYMEGGRLVVDPVCGASLREEKAITAIVRREVRFFCSKECGRKFLAAPWRYEDEEWVDRQPPQE
jgi:YHS domain-containing protein